MVKLWKQWCRLCAREDRNDSHINIFVKGEEVSSLSETINKIFSIFVSCQDDWPQTICTRCHQLVTAIISFAQRASKVQTMFAELCDSLEEIDAGKLKVQYELQEFDDVELELKLFANSPGVQLYESKPTTTPDVTEQMTGIDELKYIDEAMFDANNIKTKNGINTEDVSCDENCKDQSAGSAEDDCGDYENTKQECESGDSQMKKGKKRRLRRQECGTYNCNECSKKYKLFTNYRIHMQTEHAVALQPPQDKMFVCEECGQKYKFLGMLKVHMLKHTEERPFKCSLCEKSFKSKLTLKVHEDTHNETKYICTRCGLQLNTRRTLRMHMVVHSDQKQHKCDFCGNEYKRAKALKTHLILHTGLKPYTCNFCEKTFANGANCRSHKKKVHPVELAEMEAAGTRIVTANIPKLEHLRAATSSRYGTLAGEMVSKEQTQICLGMFRDTMSAS